MKRAFPILAVLVALFAVGYGVARYRGNKSVTLDRVITHYDRDGSVLEQYASTRMENLRGEWVVTRVLPNGHVLTKLGKLNFHPDEAAAKSTRHELYLGREVAVIGGVQEEAWYDPVTHQDLKFVRYYDAAMSQPEYVVETTAIKE